MKYNDTTIDNIQDYLKWIDDVKEVMVRADNDQTLSFPHGHTYYRGQACLSWELKPSVFRKSYDEKELLKKASLKLWSEISNLKTDLEKLVYFQHYGLPTRLLDVTYNPIIALFFACSSHEECDGVIYNGYMEESKLQVLTAKFIFNLSNFSMEEAMSFFDEETNHEILELDALCSPMFLEPPINNPRLEAQNGAFIMAPLLSKESDNNFNMNNKGFEDTGVFDERRAVIPHAVKSKLLIQLSELGIDCGYIFKDVAHKLEAIKLEDEWNMDKVCS